MPSNYQAQLDTIGAAADTQVKDLEAALAKAGDALSTAQQVNSALNAQNEELKAEVARLQAIIDAGSTPEPPVPPVTTKTRYGSASGPTGTKAVDALFGGIDCVRAFTSGPLPSSWATFKDASEATKTCTALFSAKENVKAIAAAVNAGGGAALTDLSNRWYAFCRSIPLDQEAVGIPFHEMEDNIEAGEFTAAEYRTFAKAIAGIIKTVQAERAAKSPTAKRLWSGDINMAYSLTAGSKRSMADYEVPELDIKGFDCYSLANAKLVVAYVDKQNKPWMIGETAPKASLSKPDAGYRDDLKALVDCYQTAKVPPKFVAYFNSNVGGDYTLEVATKPLTVAYWKGKCQEN